MDVLFALLVIGSIILSNVNKKKKREQQEAQKRAAEARAAAAAAELGNAKPAEPAPRPVPAPKPAASPAFEKYPSISSTAAGEGETAPAQAVLRNAPRERSSTPPTARMETTLQTTLRDKPYQHRLDSSVATGHAHEETSITGVQGDCAPEKPDVSGKHAAEPRKASAPAPVPGFVWDQNAVLSGLVMAEILGKPKCLRSQTLRSQIR